MFLTPIRETFFKIIKPVMHAYGVSSSEISKGTLEEARKPEQSRRRHIVGAALQMREEILWFE
ncbi:hypothetical protein PanWU01x14_348390, partial [Parasponia andersonii]